MYDSARDRYNMILGRYLWTELWLNLELYEHVIEGDDRHFTGYTAPMVDLGAYIFKDLNTGEIKPE